MKELSDFFNDIKRCRRCNIEILGSWNTLYCKGCLLRKEYSYVKVVPKFYRCEDCGIEFINDRKPTLYKCKDCKIKYAKEYRKKYYRAKLKAI